MVPYRRDSKVKLSPRLKFSVGRGVSQNQAMRYATYFCILVTATLSLNAARLYWQSRTVGNLPEAPQVLGASDTASQPFEFTEYKVVKGDTLFSVSQRFNINWATLATLNGLQSPFTLKAGQVLKVPKN